MYFFQVSKSFAKPKPWIAVSSFKARTGLPLGSLSLRGASPEGKVPAASGTAVPRQGLISAGVLACLEATVYLVR